MSSELEVKRLTGQAITAHLPELARLRIHVFRDFPYLYDGDLADEERYLETHVRSPRSLIVVVLDGDHIVGTSTALPLADATPDVIAPFVARGYEPHEVFYLDESVLLPEHLGRGLGVRLFQEREAHARELGGFRWTSFCAVDRPPDHPRRPAGYVPLDSFWEKRGYRKQPELKATFSWRDLDETQETPKSMTFWMKYLAP